MRGLRSFAVLLLSLTLASTAVQGQGDSSRVEPPPVGPGRSGVAIDPPPMITGGDLLRLGVAGALAGVAYHLDESARDAVRGEGAQASGPLRTISNVTDVYGQGGVVVIGAALWGGGLLRRNETIATAGFRALEAIAVSGIVTKVVKGAAGRSRPRVTPHRHDDFDLGRGFGVIDGDYESLPSGHATAAFAFAAAVTGEVARRAPRHARTVAITTYGLGALTAYSRMHVDAHWLSDVTLGAGIGLVSGWAVTRWHATRPDNRVDRFFLRPVLSRDASGATRIGLLIETR